MKILLATDGSAYSEEAAKFLTCFRFAPQDSIYLFHVVTQIPYEDDYHKQVLHFIKRFSPEILQSCADCIATTKAALIKEEVDGVPEDEIVKTAKVRDVDLIVMGARGVKGIASLFLGSVTRAVAIQADRPLLVTKPHEEKVCRPLKILFATDGSDSAQVTARVLSEMPFMEGSELTILNIAWSSFVNLPDRYAMEVNTAMKNELEKIRAMESERAEKVLAKARTLLSESFGQVHTLIKGGDPTAVVLKTAEEIKADLIAVGSRGHKGVKGMLGSVARRILGRSKCAVLIGKEEDR
jgi:nucleotide-binding universal stress UspA family protein